MARSPLQPGGDLREVIVKARASDSDSRQPETFEVLAHFPHTPLPEKLQGRSEGLGCVQIPRQNE